MSQNEDNQLPQESDTKAGASLAVEMKLVMEVFALLNAAVREDQDNNGREDWQDLLDMVQKANQALVAFKDKLPGLTLATLLPELQSLQADVIDVYNEATKLLGHDIEDLRKRFPELLGG